METSTPLPRVWSAPTDDLRDLLSERGPFVTVVLDTSGNIDNAAQRIDVQWRDLRRVLVDQGAPDDLLDGISRFTEAPQLFGRTLVVVANASGVIHVSHLAS